MLDKHHFIYYFVLFVITALGVFLLLQKNLSLNAHYLIAFVICFFYIAWGILHHVVSHSTTLKIVLEYLLIGIIGFLLISFLLQN